MADHGEVEYATAEGNDLPAHEDGYENFVHFTVIGAVLVVNILVGFAPLKPAEFVVIQIEQLTGQASS